MVETTRLDQLIALSGFVIIGHRGAAGLAPENTLRSFQQALDLGCPMLELDVHVTKDIRGHETLLVIHDDSLSRTTSGRGSLSKYNLEQLRRLDAGQGQHIPILDEVVTLVRAHTGAPPAINIELKGKGSGAVTAGFIERHPELNLLVSSFDLQELDAFRHQDQTTPVAVLLDRYREDWHPIARSLQASAINLSERIATAGRIQAIRAAGYHIFVYTVNRPNQARTLKAAGATGIFTDRPDVMFDAGLHHAD